MGHPLADRRPRIHAGQRAAQATRPRRHRRRHWPGHRRRQLLRRLPPRPSPCARPRPVQRPAWPKGTRGPHRIRAAHRGSASISSGRPRPGSEGARARRARKEEGERSSGRASPLLVPARSHGARGHARSGGGAHGTVVTSAGMVLRPWRMTQSTPFGLSLRVDYLVVRESATHFDADDPSPVTAARWVSGSTRSSTRAAPFVGDRGLVGPGGRRRLGAHLYLCARRAGRDPPGVRVVAEAGFQLRF